MHGIIKKEDIISQDALDAYDEIISKLKEIIHLKEIAFGVKPPKDNRTAID